MLHINKENCDKGIVDRVFDLLVEFRDLREGQKHKKNISADREGQKEGRKLHRKSLNVQCMVSWAQSLIFRVLFALLCRICNKLSL